MAQWRIVFWITCIALSLSAIIYIIFASAEQQPWNNPEQTKFVENGVLHESIETHGKTNGSITRSNESTDATVKQ